MREHYDCGPDCPDCANLEEERDMSDVSQEEADRIFNTERIKRAEEEAKRKLAENAKKEEK